MIWYMQYVHVTGGEWLTGRTGLAYLSYSCSMQPELFPGRTGAQNLIYHDDQTERENTTEGS